MSKVTPFLWFVEDAKRAAEFYVSLFDDSRILWVQNFPSGGAMQGGVYTLAFELQGREYYAINGGPDIQQTEAFSLYIEVETQDEIDRLWNALLAGGGEPLQCGWLKDRWGMRWQVVPKQLQEYFQDPDPDAVNRTVQAMLSMTKFDLAGLKAAHDG